MLAKFAQSKKHQWSSFIDTCIYPYNTSRHSSTHLTPFELMFGRCATLPIDLNVRAALPEEEARHFLGMPEPDQKQCAKKRAEWLELEKKNIVAAQAKRKAAYDKKHAKPLQFQKGSLSSKKTLHGRNDEEANWRLHFWGRTSFKASYKGERTNWSLRMWNQQFAPPVHTWSHTANPALIPPLMNNLQMAQKCTYVNFLHFVDR